MTYPTVYDKAKWHYEGEFPQDLPIEQAFVHIGFVLAWLIDHDMISEEFAEDFTEEIDQYKTRRISGPRLLQIADGALVSDMINDEGNRFLEVYYHATNDFYDDLENLAKRLPSTYHIEDNRQNYEKLSRTINKRFKAWQKSRAS